MIPDWILHTLSQLTQHLSGLPSYLWQLTGQYAPVSWGGWAIALWLLWRMSHWAMIWFWALLPFTGRTARVVRCADGDTIQIKKLMGEDTVRLIGIDTPESVRSMYQEVMPFGKEASDYTRRRLRKGQLLLLHYDRDKRDKFGRLLAYVYLPSGEFYNATLVRKGYAFAEHYPPNDRHLARLRRLEARARRAQRGLWRIYRSKQELTERYRRSEEYRAFKQRKNIY